MGAPVKVSAKRHKCPSGIQKSLGPPTVVGPHYGRIQRAYPVNFLDVVRCSFMEGAGDKGWKRVGTGAPRGGRRPGLPTPTVPDVGEFQPVGRNRRGDLAPATSAVTLLVAPNPHRQNPGLTAE